LLLAALVVSGLCRPLGVGARSCRTTATQRGIATTSDQIALLSLLISTIITTVGWIFTASFQRRILRESASSQQLERELAVFRERFTLVRGVTGGLLEQSNAYMQLIAMFLSPGFDFEEDGNLLRAEGPKTFELAKVLSDPAFRSMRGLLPGDHAKRLLDGLKASSDKAPAFHAWATSITPLTPNLTDVFKEAASRAQEVAKQ